MKHATIVAKILEHALSGNTEGVQAYGTLLVEKLEAEGEALAARVLRAKLVGEPVPEAERIVPLKQE